MSRGFTLIEILIAVILLGVGATSAIALIAINIRQAQEVTALTTMGPTANAAAAWCAVRHVTTSQFLPGSNTDFQSPFAIVVDTGTDAGQTPPDPTRSLPNQATTGELVVYRIRIYNSAEDREHDLRRLGTMFIRQYLRAGNQP